MTARTVVTALTLAAGAGAGAAPADAVVGGTPVPPGALPSVARIVVGGTSGCTGTLVAPRWVLSADRCPPLHGHGRGRRLSAAAPGGMVVAIGSVQPSGAGGERLRVARVVTAGAGTTLLHLAAPARTAPTPVAGRGLEALWAPDALATVAGFGPTSARGRAPVAEEAAALPVVSDAACARARRAFTATTQLCAGEDRGERGPCRDDGAPLLAQADDGRRYVVGVAAAAGGCPDAPGLFARVAGAPLRNGIRSHAPDAVADAGAGVSATPMEVYDPATGEVRPGGPRASASVPPHALDEIAAASSGFVAALRADRTPLRTLGGRGARVGLRCSVACSASFVLSADGVTARRLGLRGTLVAFAALRRPDAGRSTLRIRVSHAVERGLARLPQARLTLRAVVGDRAGRRVVLARGLAVG